MALYLSSRCVLIALEPAHDATFEFNRLSSHGTAVTGSSRFPERNIWVVTLTSRENHF